MLYGGGLLTGMYADTMKDLGKLAGGNQVKVWALNQYNCLLEAAAKKNAGRNIESEPPSPSVAFPILEAASLETREDIRELWVRLLAAAMDPVRKNQVRVQFVGILKAMGPVDAAILNAVSINQASASSERSRYTIASRLKITEDEVETSMLHLISLDLLCSLAGRVNPVRVEEAQITVVGREFMRCVNGC